MAFELRAKIGLDNSPLIAGLEQSKNAVRNFKGALGGHVAGELSALRGQFAAAFGVAAITSGITSVVEFGGRISDLAAKTSLSTDEVQALDYATTQASASFEKAAHALKRITASKGAAFDGNQDAIRDFKRLGVSMDDLRSKSPIELFRQIGAELGKGATNAQTFSAMLGVMGKDADGLLPAFRDGLADVIGQFETLGASIDENLINKLDTAGDKMDDMKVFWRAQTAGFASEFADVFGGTISNFSLAFEGLFHLITDRASNAVKEVGDDVASDFWAQAMIGGDEFAHEVMDQAKRLQSELDRKRSSRGANGEEEKDRLHDFTPSKFDGPKAAIRQQFDSLARIGGFGQGAGSDRARILSLHHQQVQLLSQLVANTRPSGGGGLP